MSGELWAVIAAIIGSNALGIVVGRGFDRLSPARASEERARLQKDMELLRTAAQAPRDRFSVAHEAIIRAEVARLLAGRAAPSSRWFVAIVGPAAMVFLVGGPALILFGDVGEGTVVFAAAIGLLILCVNQNDGPMAVADQIERLLATGEVPPPPRRWTRFVLWLAPAGMKRRRDDLARFITEPPNGRTLDG